MVLPSCSFRIGREGFGGNDRFTPSVGGPGHGRGMMEPGVIVRFVPELGHRHIGASGVSEIVQRAVAIAFDNYIETMLMREFGKAPGIIVGDEIGDGSPDIPKKSF